MHPSLIIADKIRVLLATPMLYEFFNLARYKDDAWACQLVSRISALVQEEAPRIRSFGIDDSGACALNALLGRGEDVALGDLLRDPWDRERRLACIALLLERGADRQLLPGDDVLLQAGDRLLLCAGRGVFTRLDWTICYSTTLDYVRTGSRPPSGWLWRKLAGRRRR
jgi:hypothetical protein